MSIDSNNFKPTSSETIIIIPDYSATNIFADNGIGINVDEEHALMVKSKCDIKASLRSEKTGRWITLSIPKRKMMTINVSDFDLINFYDTVDDSSRRRHVRVRALFNTYSDNLKSLDSSLDNALANKGKIEWLPKFTIVQG